MTDEEKATRRRMDRSKHGPIPTRHLLAALLALEATREIVGSASGVTSQPVNDAIAAIEKLTVRGVSLRRMTNSDDPFSLLYAIADTPVGEKYAGAISKREGLLT